MVEANYDQINSYGSVKIKLASPEDIRSWSYGEVKKPETINYRTYRSEKDGLFCEKIFGPEKDWECSCGKYRGIKHKGIICDRCGVKVIHSRVRRKRMGHINLASPVAHIWFFKAMPSRMGILLGLKSSELERVIYFQDYIVMDPGSTPLTRQQLLTPDPQYKEARDQFGNDFEAGMGAEAIKLLLERLDLKSLSEQLRVELKETTSKQRIKEITRRLQTVEMLRDSDNKPEWMILDAIPVIPPDLRPLVLLESGNFATSDLNDLYRRLINRNNRLKKLFDLNAPDVIIRNEKRMLQQAVDALFDNGRCRRAVLGSSNRPLKSLTDMIKGKQGRFRDNLLGKRVDYSARSVIVVGPELKIHNCGLPKKIALELFQPFIIRRLKELALADTIKSAKKMLERKDEEVWDILEEVIQGHPVLLNRAPTLHRMGIQAFEPILVEGNAIKIHPLVCAGFNADFDGDQMAVHLPLSIEAQVEASALMLSVHNVFSPASGRPVITPSQDIVLGLYYITVDRPSSDTETRVYTDTQEVIHAYYEQKIVPHQPIYLRREFRKNGEPRAIWGPGRVVQLPGRLVRKKDGTLEWTEDAETGTMVKTTAGRVIFNDILPDGMPFYNYPLDKGNINLVVEDCHRFLGRIALLKFLDDLKALGFKAATRAGLSFGKDDLRIPAEKGRIIDDTQKLVDRVEGSFKKGLITKNERYNQIVDLWTHAREKVGERMMAELREDRRPDTRTGKQVPYFNPVFAMAMSGARGSVDQIRQLAGMRGLMAKPSGKIIETPIKANFREGLRVLEYFSSTHGARKGLADTALKTADSGYLTRKLADVAQNVVVNEHDCGSTEGVAKGVVRRGERVEVPLWRAIYGRTSCQNFKDPRTGKAIVKKNEVIHEDQAKRIEETGIDKFQVRSPLTCRTAIGVCARCYGMDLSRGEIVEPGLAVGIIAAQSIGEPGTQLTMRTFHIGGVAGRIFEEKEKIFTPPVSRGAKREKVKGKVEYVNLRFAHVALSEDEKAGKGTKAIEKKTIILNRNAELVIKYLDPNDEVEKEEKYVVPIGARLLVDDGEAVDYGARLAEWDPHYVPILAEVDGIVRFEDIIPNVTMREEEEGDILRKVIIEHKGEKHPQIKVEDKEGNQLAWYAIPEKANIEVEDGQKVKAGWLLAKTPKEVGGTQDITGGLPRVTELFEARKPKSPAIISEIDGIVELGKKRRGKRTIIVKGPGGLEREHLVPHGKHLRVHTGDKVKVGEPLVDGALVPGDILQYCGERDLYNYLQREIQNVYRAQNVTIDDKHIEVIVSQMMRRVKVTNPGDTEYLPGQVINKFRLYASNEDVKKKGGQPAEFEAVLLGITKASLQSDSFISAASFQETTKVLTEAALASKVDELKGLKENVILGHLIPAGTGFSAYQQTSVKKEGGPWPTLEREEEPETATISDD